MQPNRTLWLRVPGDIVFAFGVLALALYAVKLLARAGKVAPAPVAAAERGAG
jgi:nitric oxide reductase subunit B